MNTETNTTNLSSSTFKLKFNHPVKEIYPFLTDNDIKKCFREIREKTDYKNGPIPHEIFQKFILNKN